MEYVGGTPDGRQVCVEKLGGTKWRVRITKPSGSASTYTSNKLPRILRYVARHTQSLPFIAEYTTQMSNKHSLVDTYSDVLLLEPVNQ